MKETSYTTLRKNLSSTLDDIENNRETYFVTRRGHDDVIMLARDDYESLIETLHLLSSKKNAKKIQEAIDQEDDCESTKNIWSWFKK